ncbi:MAG: DUF2147 domain-containing protein [Rhodanobacter sp.]|nr:MAG: DUF2147 domain-containing protein [Rhodanobacter sp.]TAM12117.1 MAG: DUF2147 domain-containing protein [Rhodanobacter sp.]TAM34542.1 MAG: DUF2147 domain-containing protein [Rhodanobacter sp.]
MKPSNCFALVFGLLLAAGPALAANDTPAGTWKTIDDTTHQAKSIVEISEHDGEYQAKIVKLLNRSPEDIARDGDVALCHACSGARKDKPIEGMVIMWGVRQDGTVWDGGKILDPKSGKIYKVKLSMLDGGQKLDVHGYIGFALLGRSQVWERQ